MKKITRGISGMLAFLTVAGLVSSFSVTPIFATGSDTKTDEDTTVDYLTEYYATPEEKLATMERKLSLYGYELYCLPATGEVAYRNAKTGEILFTNPYDVAKCGGGQTKATKQTLLSQLIVNYTEIRTGSEKTLSSFRDCALSEQLNVKNIRNGIRVEYAIGTLETRSLVPRLIEKSKLEDLILANMVEDEYFYPKMKSFYTLKDPNDEALTERGRNDMYLEYPITAKGIAVYTTSTNLAAKDRNEIETYIKLYCPNFTYELLEEIHSEVGYEDTDEDPALFRMALEYYLDENGLLIRMPANGIRYNETLYSLSNIQILPYFGASSSENTGYNLIPDGSGAIIRNENMQNATNITGDLYGVDYAYHSVTIANRATWRMPIFGVVENVTLYKPESDEEEPSTQSGDSTAGDGEEREVLAKYDRGYVAVIEEGDALAKITSTHGGNKLHKYNSVYTTFYPRPKDSYDLSSTITVGDNSTWTVVSKRKYSGSYRIRVMMLSDANLAQQNDFNGYECSYVGMAKAYRDYLEKTGVLQKLETAQNTDLPLYIESFGCIDTTKSFLSFTRTVKLPLTSFDDLVTMHNKLSEKGVSNVYFKLVGYVNGGMNYTAPYHVKFVDEIGGNSGYQELLKKSAESGFRVFPDFDFMYLRKVALFDGVSYSKDAVKTIDNRYISKRTYDLQSGTTNDTGLICISSGAMGRIYDHFTQEYNEILGDATLRPISVSTLGSDLNSDFDENDPLNREDAKNDITNLMKRMRSSYEIMTDAGNSFVVPYANHILNAPIDSSHFTNADEAVPMFGLIYHGYVSFSGSPTNMTGDIKREVLRLIENGASPYFILSYQNTMSLKGRVDYANYYSVSFNTWLDTLVEVYTEVNGLLRDLQNVRIANHSFPDAQRIPSADEKKADEDAEAARLEANRLAQEEADRKNELSRKLLERILEEGGTPILITEVIPELIPPEDLVAKYATSKGSVVRVEYENGVTFYLNYNRYAITVDGYVVEALSYFQVK